MKLTCYRYMVGVGALEPCEDRGQCYQELVEHEPAPLRFDAPSRADRRRRAREHSRPHRSKARAVPFFPPIEPLETRRMDRHIFRAPRGDDFGVYLPYPAKPTPELERLLTRRIREDYPHTLVVTEAELRRREMMHGRRW